MIRFLLKQTKLLHAASLTMRHAKLAPPSACSARWTLTLIIALLTTAKAWATTTSTINVGGTDYTLFTGFTATDGNGRNYAKLVDGNTTSDWSATKNYDDPNAPANDFAGGTADPAFVEFHADEPIVPKGYVLTCDHENAGFWKPVEWALKARLNESDTWTTIHSSNTTLGAGKTFEIACDNDGDNEYQYFRFEVYEVGTTMTVDLDELQFYGLLPTYTHLTIKAATCMATGINVDCYRRNSDGKYFTDNTGETEIPESDVIAPIIPHTGEHHDATDVNIEYWQCSMCGKYFSDSGYTTEITEEDTKIYRTITIDNSISGLVTVGFGKTQALAGTTMYLYVSDLIDASTLKVNDGAVEVIPDGGDWYKFTMPAADVTVTAEVAQSNVDGDILTGSIKHRVTITDGASITLNNATISGSIVCEGTATITLVGTNSVSGATNKAGIQIGGSGTTLTIKGDGSLTANGGSQSAGIGLSRIWNYDSNVTSGDIVIEGGTITATGGNWGAGIGTGVVKNTNNDNTTSVQFGTITIKGGSVTATGGDSGDGIGKGYAYSGPTITIGTVTICDGIDKVDASSITNFGNVVYKHMDGETETNVTASKGDYFTIIEDGNRRIIVQKVNPAIAEIPDQTYTGSAITPEPLVIAGSLSLTKGTDYVYSYTNNTNVGTATVRATFQGTYASLGYVEKTFTITPSTIMVSVTGSGTVTIGDKSASDGEAFGVMSEKGASVVLTLAPESGNAVRSVEYGYTNNNNSGTTVSGRKLPITDGTATLTVPTDLKDGTGVTLTVTFAAALVGGADEASAVALTDATVTDLGGGWYKVTDDITFDHMLNLLGDTHLILAEGATMTVNAATTRGIDSDYTLTVGGAGALSVTATGTYDIAIRVCNYVQTGATVTASGYIGIRCKDNFEEFNVTNDFTFSGGQLTVTGTSDGIWADNTITISCTNGSDFIQSSSYEVLSGGTVKVADGKALTDGTNVYSGTLTNAQKTAIANQTLRKSCWTELKMALEAGQSVTLTNDVDRINSDHIEPTGTVTLDLNGYTIDGGTTQTNPLFSVNNGVSMTITDSRTGGNLCNSGTNPTVSVNGGTLTLAAGTINAQSGGVYVYKGSFTMTDGIITGATISGVDLGDNATFTMTGGSITGNETGVNVGSANATFTVSGNVNITGNTKNSITTDVSLYYDGTSFNPIHIGGALNEAARIGINIDDYAASAITGDVVKVITNGLKDNGTKQNFVLNGRDGLALVNNANGELTIAKIYSLTVPENVTVSGLTAESGNTYNVGCGDVVTLLYGADDVTSGWSVRYTVPNGAITYLGAVDAQGKYAEFTMPGDNTTITKADIDNHFTFGGITLKESFSSGASQGLDATFDGTSEVTIDLPNPITVKSVKYNRTFTTGKCATIMLPFSMDVSNISGTNFYTFGGVEKNSSDKWIATMNQVTGTLAANTPYLVEPTATTLTFTGGATLNTTGGSNQQTADAGSNWMFKGTYAYREWITDGANSDEIGKAYGFAGVQKTGIEIGDFVRVASGAKIRPMGCYLLWSDTPNAAPARRMTRAAAADELPSRITVRLVGSNGETTGIGELDTKTGELSFDGWWTLDGTKLSGKPTKKGLYINNGKKIVIK